MKNTIQITLVVPTKNMAEVAKFLQKNYDANCTNPFQRKEEGGAIVCFVCPTDRAYRIMDGISEQWPNVSVFTSVDKEAGGRPQKIAKLKAKCSPGNGGIPNGSGRTKAFIGVGDQRQSVSKVKEYLKAKPDVKPVDKPDAKPIDVDKPDILTTPKTETVKPTTK